MKEQEQNEDRDRESALEKKNYPSPVVCIIFMPATCCKYVQIETLKLYINAGMMSM